MTSSEEQILNIANHLSKSLGIAISISDLKQINYAFFESVFFAMFGDDCYEDFIPHPSTEEAQQHNMHSLLKYLETAVLEMSLSHIRVPELLRGTAIVQRNLLLTLDGVLSLLPSSSTLQHEMTADQASVTPSPSRSYTCHTPPERDSPLQMLPEQSNFPPNSSQNNAVGDQSGHQLILDLTATGDNSPVKYIPLTDCRILKNHIQHVEQVAERVSKLASSVMEDVVARERKREEREKYLRRKLLEYMKQSGLASNANTTTTGVSTSLQTNVGSSAATAATGTALRQYAIDDSECGTGRRSHLDTTRSSASATAWEEPDPQQMPWFQQYQRDKEAALRGTTISTGQSSSRSQKLSSRDATGANQKEGDIERMEDAEEHLYSYAEEHHDFVNGVRSQEKSFMQRLSGDERVLSADINPKVADEWARTKTSLIKQAYEMDWNRRYATQVADLQHQRERVARRDQVLRQLTTSSSSTPSSTPREAGKTGLLKPVKRVLLSSINVGRHGLASSSQPQSARGKSVSRSYSNPTTQSSTFFREHSYNSRRPTRVAEEEVDDDDADSTTPRAHQQPEREDEVDLDQLLADVEPDENEDEFLSSLLARFPHLEISREALRYMWDKATHQKELQWKNQHAEMQHQRTAAAAANSRDVAHETVDRQRLLHHLLEKEVRHHQRYKDVCEQRAVERSLKSRQRERRQEVVHSKRYHENYVLAQRSKLLMRQSKEELLFKQVFDEVLKLQKEKRIEAARLRKETQHLKASEQRRELESLENFYRDKFAMLAESLEHERRAIEMQSKAQDRTLQNMRREMRHKMEKQIEELQEELVRSQRDTYFRELDAQRVIQDVIHQHQHNRGAPL